MLLIRDVQLRALGEANWHAFKRRAERHCRQWFPEICLKLGEQGVASYVESGLQKARSLGFVSERQLLKYLNLVFSFGPQFYELPWAAPVLEDTSFSPSVRIQVLTETALNQLKPPPDLSHSVASTPQVTEREDAFANWPETPLAPVPAPVELRPPGETAFPPPPPSPFGMDDHYAW